jgi:hypothetical protein
MHDEFRRRPRPQILDQLRDALREPVRSEMDRQGLQLSDIMRLMHWATARRGHFSTWLRGEDSEFGYTAALAVAEALKIAVDFNISSSNQRLRIAA